MKNKLLLLLMLFANKANALSDAQIEEMSKLYRASHVCSVATRLNNSLYSSSPRTPIMQTGVKVLGHEAINKLIEANDDYVSELKKTSPRSIKKFLQTKCWRTQDEHIAKARTIYKAYKDEQKALREAQKEAERQAELARQEQQRKAEEQQKAAQAKLKAEREAEQAKALAARQARWDALTDAEKCVELNAAYKQKRREIWDYVKDNENIVEQLRKSGELSTAKEHYRYYTQEAKTQFERSEEWLTRRTANLNCQ